MPVDPGSGVYFELHGHGQPLMIGLPLMASHLEIFGEGARAMLDGYLVRLTDRYRVVLIDYPAIGRSADIAPDALSADRVCADLLSVADAAGFDRFAWFGYSWSGAVGLQLADRTDRLSALVIGGWPPLDAPYAAIHAASIDRIGQVPDSAMAILRSTDQYRQWSTFYASIAHWDEGVAVARIACPRMIFFGGEGDLEEAGHDVPIASAIRNTRPVLEAAGWHVQEFPGEGHSLIVKPELVVPALRHFLDTALPA